MSFRIFWSAEAELSYLKILEYLDQKWSEKEIENFIHRTDTVLAYIIENPFLYQRIKNNTFKAVLTKQISVLYTIQESEIYLHFFWDNRQDPEKLKL